MFDRFYPKEYAASTYNIDYEKFYKKGYRGILFDIDNTLVEHNADADDNTVLFFENLKKLGFDVCLLSNNKEDRVKRFNKNLNLKYVHKAGKPGKKAYNEGILKIKCHKNNTFFIGDQIFTDIYGANRAGIYSILVKPIAKKEEIQIVLKRYLEKIVLYFYKRQIRRVTNG